LNEGIDDTFVSGLGREPARKLIFYCSGLSNGRRTTRWTQWVEPWFAGRNNKYQGL